MPLDKDMLLEQYRQCNEHHRECDRKRDVILGFYITMSVALYGFAIRVYPADTLTINVVDTSLFLFGILGLVVVGFIVGLLCTMYRGWHGFLIIQQIVLQDMIHKKKYNIDVGVIKEIDYKFNLFKSVEFLMFILLHAVIIMHLAAAFLLSKNCHWRPLVIGFSCAVGIEFLSHFIAMIYLDRQKINGKLTTKYFWLLQHTINNSQGRKKKTPSTSQTKTSPSKK